MTDLRNNKQHSRDDGYKTQQRSEPRFKSRHNFNTYKSPYSGTRLTSDGIKKTPEVQPISQKTYEDYLDSVEVNEDHFNFVDDPTIAERTYSAFSSVKSYAITKAPVIIDGGSKFYSKLNSKINPKLQQAKTSKFGQKIFDFIYKVGKVKFYSTITVTALVIFVGVGFIFNWGGGKNIDTANEGQVVLGAEQVVRPTFPTLESDTVQDEQGLVFDPSVGVAAFRDTIQGSTVTVSQQPLSDEQKKDPQEFLSTVAVNLFAQGSFESNKGTVHYTIPLPDIDDSQVAMFTFKGLLVFVRTQGISINPEVWETYINSLR